MTDAFDAAAAHVRDPAAGGRPPDARGFLHRWVEASNNGDWTAVEAMLRPDATLHDPMAPQPATGRTAVLARVQAQYAPFPDGRVEMLEAPFVSVDGHQIAYRWRFTGTHSRRVDPPGFGATGLVVRVEGCSFLLLVEGRAQRIMLYFDTTEVARQLLAAPRAGSPLERGLVLVQRARVRVRRVRTLKRGS